MILANCYQLHINPQTKPSQQFELPFKKFQDWKKGVAKGGGGVTRKAE